MLARKHKISSELFKKNHHLGTKKFSSHIRYVFVHIDDKSDSRCAVIISKKVLKKAVHRNKQKRRIYNILSEIYPQICKGQLVFLFIQKDISKVSYTDLVQEIQPILLLK